MKIQKTQKLLFSLVVSGMGFAPVGPNVARLLCKMIPAHCPFERDIKFFGYIVFHIPPLCKLNPLYDQVVGLRLRALSYLADECGEDIALYTADVRHRLFNLSDDPTRGCSDCDRIC